MEGQPERRIVEGELFGAPVPGRWPGGQEPARSDGGAVGEVPARGGRWVLGAMSPPYPPKGLLSIDGDGLVWSPTPRGWKNFTRWLDVRNPHPIRILWTEVLELRLEPGVRDRRNLRVCLPDGPYAAERNSWFGSVSRTELIAVCENLGCTVKADPTHPGEEIISLPGRASGAD